MYYLTCYVYIYIYMPLSVMHPLLPRQVQSLLFQSGAPVSTVDRSREHWVTWVPEYKTGGDYRSYPRHFRWGKFLGPSLYQTAAIYNSFSGFIWFVPMIFIEVSSRIQFTSSVFRLYSSWAENLSDMFLYIKDTYIHLEHTRTRTYVYIYNF